MNGLEPLNPEALGRPSGWSHAMVAPAGGRIVFVAGQVAPEVDPAPSGPDASEDLARRTERLVAQFGAALERALRVVAEAGGGPEHVGRMTIFVVDMEAYRASLAPLGTAYRSVMGRRYPAMALVEVTSLVDPAAVVEIETTAVVPADRRRAG